MRTMNRIQLNGTWSPEIPRLYRRTTGVESPAPLLLTIFGLLLLTAVGDSDDLFFGFGDADQRQLPR